MRLLRLFIVQKKGGADAGADGDAIITPNSNALLLPLFYCLKIVAQMQVLMVTPSSRPIYMVIDASFKMSRRKMMQKLSLTQRASSHPSQACN